MKHSTCSWMYTALMCSKLPIYSCKIPHLLFVKIPSAQGKSWGVLAWMTGRSKHNLVVCYRCIAYCVSVRWMSVRWMSVSQGQQYHACFFCTAGCALSRKRVPKREPVDACGRRRLPGSNTKCEKEAKHWSTAFTSL